MIVGCVFVDNVSCFLNEHVIDVNASWKTGCKSTSVSIERVVACIACVS